MSAYVSRWIVMLVVLRIASTVAAFIVWSDHKRHGVCTRCSWCCLCTLRVSFESQVACQKSKHNAMVCLTVCDDGCSPPLQPPLHVHDLDLGQPRIHVHFHHQMIMRSIWSSCWEINKFSNGIRANSVLQHQCFSILGRLLPHVHHTNRNSV